MVAASCAACSSLSSCDDITPDVPCCPACGVHLCMVLHYACGTLGGPAVCLVDCRPCTQLLCPQLCLWRPRQLNSTSDSLLKSLCAYIYVSQNTNPAVCCCLNALPCCNIIREEFSAFLLLERAEHGGDSGDAAGSSKRSTALFQPLEQPGSAGAAPAPTATASAHRIAAGAGAGSGAGADTHSGSGHVHRFEPITALLHFAPCNALDRWYSTSRDGLVQVWNGKVSLVVEVFVSKRGRVDAPCILRQARLLP